MSVETANCLYILISFAFVAGCMIFSNPPAAKRSKGIRAAYRAKRAAARASLRARIRAH